MLKRENPDQLWIPSREYLNFCVRDKPSAGWWRYSCTSYFVGLAMAHESESAFAYVFFRSEDVKTLLIMQLLWLLSSVPQCDEPFQIRIKMGSVLANTHLCHRVCLNWRLCMPLGRGRGRLGSILFWGCTFGGVYVPCIYSHARWQLPHAIHDYVVVSLDSRALLIPFIDPP